MSFRFLIVTRLICFHSFCSHRDRGRRAPAIPHAVSWCRGLVGHESTKSYFLDLIPACNGPVASKKPMTLCAVLITLDSRPFPDFFARKYAM